MIWTRMSAAGNSFFIANQLSESSQKQNQELGDRSRLAQRLCSGFKNAGTDGLIVLEPSQRADFKWDFYNSDGSQAEMCGNAARCVGLYYYQTIAKKEKLVFEATAGLIRWEMTSDQKIRVEMPPLDFPKEISGAFFIDSGVPHLVLQQKPDLEVAKKYRPLPDPRGSNVTFISVESPNQCQAVTYERGVEGFTAACGTGAVAAAAYLYQTYGASHGTQTYQVEMPGGLLRVQIEGFGRRPHLIGDAGFDYRIET